MDGITVRLHTDNMNWWLALPTTRDKLLSAMTEIGAADGNFTVDRSRAGFNDKLDEFIIGGDIHSLNYLAMRLTELSPDQAGKLEAMLDSPLRPDNLAQLIDCTYNTDVIELYPHVYCPEDLARHYFDSAGETELPQGWAMGVDLQKFGENLARSDGGYFTNCGYMKSIGKQWRRDFEKSGEIPPGYRIQPGIDSDGQVRHTPVYMHTIETAQNNGETDLYRASLTLNMDCALAIEEALKFSHSVKPADAKSVIDGFGHERVLAVLAHTVRENDFGSRFSQESRAWAKDFPAPPRSEYARFTVDSHPSMVNEFIVQARAVAREIESRAAQDNNRYAPSNPDISDPSVTRTDMYAYGYDYEGMIPLRKARALELFDNNYQIYKLYTDGRARVAVRRRDVEAFDGMFGVLDPVKCRQARSASIEVFILNRERYVKGEAVGDWLTLPINADTLRGLLERIGIEKTDADAFSVTAIRLPHDSLIDHVTKNDSLDELNMLASYMNGLEDYECDKLYAILESSVMDIGNGTAALINLLDADNLDAFNLIEAKDPEELGRYYAEGKPIKVGFEEYGCQIAKDEGGIFTEYGYIYCRYGELLPAYIGGIPNEYRITEEALSGLRSRTTERGGTEKKPSVLGLINAARHTPRPPKDKGAPKHKKDKGGAEI